jgi:riboflavin kinase/FMN adenylyltransferase
MKIFHSSRQAHGRIKKPVVALGNFDGVHLAHQKMFELVRKLASQLKGTPCVYTFDPHPVKILSPESAPPLITTLSQKIELMALNKIQGLILEPFRCPSPNIPEAFFEETLIRSGSSGVVAGYDFTFGAKRAGTSKFSSACAERHQVAYRILRPIFFRGYPRQFHPNSKPHP